MMKDTDEEKEETHHAGSGSLRRSGPTSDSLAMIPGAVRLEKESGNIDAS